jgi:hypothetical protein
VNRRLTLLAVSALTAVGAWFGWLRPVDAGPETELPPPRHETSDVGLRPMLLAGIGMLAALAAVLGLAALIFPRSMREQTVNLPQAQFPAPLLQPDPAADMEVLRARQLRELETAHWIDRDRRVVHIPITQAMRDVAARGIPDWPTK